MEKVIIYPTSDKPDAANVSLLILEPADFKLENLSEIVNSMRGYRWNHVFIPKQELEDFTQTALYHAIRPNIFVGSTQRAVIIGY